MENEAEEQSHLVFEEHLGARDAGLCMLHDRARRGGAPDPTALGLAWPNRATVLDKLVRCWNKAALGLRDDWLIATVWLLDRVRLRRAGGRRGECFSPYEAGLVDAWAVADSLEAVGG